MRNDPKHLNEIDILGTIGSAARSVAELPIVKNVIDFFSEVGDSPEAQEKQEQVKQALGSLQDEMIPLSKALELDTDKIAFIVGSSQAGVIGYPVMKELETRGFKNFKFNSTPAKSMDFIYASVAAGLRDKSSYDVIVIFPGFRGAENPEDVVSIIELFEPARCFVVIPPPVTEITDTFKASRLGLNAGRPVSPDYWFLVGGGKFAGKREDFCKDLVSRVVAAGATPVDPRDVVVGGDDTILEGLQPTGVSFPNSPDGIHPSDSVCQQIADAVADAIVGCQLTVPSSDVIKHIKPVDLERNPSIAQNLKDFPALSTVLGAAFDAQAPRDESMPGGFALGEELDYNRWIKQISKIEGTYTSVNKDSLALGKYQFVPSYWWDEITDFAGSRLPPHERIGKMHGRDWYSDYQAFLEDPALQEDWMKHYFENYVKPEVLKIRRDLPSQTASISDGKLAALYHFQGPEGARDWLQYKIMRGANVNVINPDEYMARVS